MTTPKGSRPFARLKLSTNAAFTDGAAVVIPFDTIDFISDTFGEITFVGGVFGSTPIFCCTSGIYSVQLQVQVSVSPVQIVAALASESGSGQDGSQIKTYQPSFSDPSITTTMNANRLSTETAYPGTPLFFPTVIYATVTSNGGGNGVFLASRTQMLIEQLTTY